MKKLFWLMLNYSDMSSKPSGRLVSISRRDVVMARFYDNKDDIKDLLHKADNKELSVDNFEKAEKKIRVEYKNYSNKLLCWNNSFVSFNNDDVYIDAESFVPKLTGKKDDTYYHISGGFFYTDWKYYVVETKVRNILDKNDFFTMVKLDYLEINIKEEFIEFLKKKVSKDNYKIILEKYWTTPQTIYVLDSKKVWDELKVKYLELVKWLYITKEMLFKNKIDFNKAVKNII